MSMLESFLTANYFGVASLLDDAKREQIDGHVIADFYITMSNLHDTSQGIKLQFPLGDYWQQMRAATTAMDMRQLQNIVLAHSGKKVSAAVPTDQVGRNCPVFRQESRSVSRVAHACQPDLVRVSWVVPKVV